MIEVLGLIPARGGSKRVPRKNIRNLAGKPLIAYTIEAALASNKIGRVVVSTDDLEIANIAKDCGAEVPFIRPAELASDKISDQSVLLHAIKTLKQQENYNPDIVLNLRPTSPFKTVQIIDDVIDMSISSNAEITRTMTKVEGVYHPYWMYKLDEQKKAFPFVDNMDINNYYQSQLLPPVYRLNGVVDAIKVSKILSGNILSGDISTVIIEENESLDIDTEEDFRFCEYLISNNHIRVST